MILLDTQVVIWIATAPRRISAKAKAAIDDARKSSEGLAISDVSLLEVAMLISKGRIEMSDIDNPESLLQEMESRFVVLPITSRTCMLATNFPKSYPKDPFDRIIGATALAAGLSLVTADRAIRLSNAVQTIW